MSDEEKRNFPYGIAWIVFLGFTFTGAGLAISSDRTRQNIGLAMLVLPLAVFGLLSLIYYIRTGRTS